jgi:hypothetical protein
MPHSALGFNRLPTAESFVTSLTYIPDLNSLQYALVQRARRFNLSTLRPQLEGARTHHRFTIRLMKF